MDTEIHHVCLFKLGIEQPVQVLMLDPAPESYEDWDAHKWSPDSQQLVVCWSNEEYASLHVARLSQAAVTERRASPGPLST